MDPDRSHLALGTDWTVLCQAGGEVEPLKFKRREQDRFAQRRHREKGKDKSRELGIAHHGSPSRPSHCSQASKNAQHATIAVWSSQSSTSESISAMTESSAYRKRSSSPIEPGVAILDVPDRSAQPSVPLPTRSTSSEKSRCDLLRGKDVVRWGDPPAEAHQQHDADLTMSHLTDPLERLQGAIAPVRAEKNREAAALKAQSNQDRVSSWLAAQSNRDPSDDCSSCPGPDSSDA